MNNAKQYEPTNDCDFVAEAVEDTYQGLCESCNDDEKCLSEDIDLLSKQLQRNLRNRRAMREGTVTRPTYLGEQGARELLGKLGIFLNK